MAIYHFCARVRIYHQIGQEKMRNSIAKMGMLWFLMLLCTGLFGQSDSTKKNSLVAYPVAFRLPETRFGAGLAAAYNFQFDKKDSISPPSQIQFGFAYTQNKQVLIYLPYEMYWKGRKHAITGELGYYNYSYFFFGVGEGNKEGVNELFKVKYPRFRFNYYYKLQDKTFAGVRWWLEDYNIYSTLEGGQLASGKIAGSRGGVSSGPGIMLLFDSRDNIYFARKGYFLEFVIHDQQKFWGSDFSFNRIRFDARYFKPLGKKLSFGVNLFGDFTKGDVPFSQMPSIGSAKRMRGSYDGRYRDQNLILFQAELRGYLYKRWGATAFMSSAILANEPTNFQVKYTHVNAGLGIRYAYDYMRRINLRIDVATPLTPQAFRKTQDTILKPGKPTVYFTIGEAF
jgi:Omp85 superfamily domain